MGSVLLAGSTDTRVPGQVLTKTSRARADAALARPARTRCNVQQSGSVSTYPLIHVVCSQAANKECLCVGMGERMRAVVPEFMAGRRASVLCIMLHAALPLSPGVGYGPELAQMGIGGG